LIAGIKHEEIKIKIISFFLYKKKIKKNIMNSLAQVDELVKEYLLVSIRIKKRRERERERKVLR
jgi:hypothetical protein